MAPYFRDPNLDKQDEQNPGSVTVSSAGQQAGTDGSVQGQSDPNKPTNSGSKFTNIDSYLNGNNAQQFGQEFGGKIQSGINDAKSNFDTTASGVESQINSQGDVPTQDQINGYISNAGDKTSDADAQKYQSWMNQTYNGPQGISDNQAAWNQYWGKAGDAKTAAEESGTESGRFALLDKYYGRPNYNFGQKSLDNVLIQNGGGFNNSADLQNQATNLDAYGNQKAQEVSSAAAQRAGQIDQAIQAARSAIGLDANNQVSGGALGNFQSTLDSKVAADNAARDSTYGTLVGDINSGNISAQDSQYLDGLQKGQPIYGLNLSNYLTQGNQVSRANDATDADYAKYLALTKLAGISPTYLTADQRAQAGKVDPVSNFDLNRFNSDVLNQQGSAAQAASTPVLLKTTGTQMSINDMKQSLATLTASLGGDSQLQHYLTLGGTAPDHVREMYNLVHNFDQKYGTDSTLSGSNSSGGLIWGNGVSRR